MPSELLLHHRLEAELSGLWNQDKRWRGAVDAAIKKLLSDPHGAGRPLKGLADHELQGRIHRLHVGGRRGYRLFYWLPIPKPNSELTLVIPAYLSENPRSGFDYDRIDLDEAGMDVVRDYREGRFDCFKRFRNPATLFLCLEKLKPQ